MNSIPVKSSIVFFTYSILSLINIYYFVARIIKLEYKNFHILMFVLLQICYTTYIAEWVIIYIQHSFEKSNIAYYLSIISFSANELLHSVFVCKFWLISRKINNVIHKTFDELVDIKALVLLIGLLAVIISSIVLEIIQNNDSNAFNNAYLVTAYYSLPPFLNIAILSHSFFTLRKCDSFEQTISKRQIML